MYCILVILSYNVPINWPEPLCIKKQSVHTVFLHPGLSIDCFIVYWSTVKSECIVFGVLFVSYVTGNIHSNIKNDFFSQRDNLLQVTFLNLFSSEIFMSASVLFFNEYLGVVLSNKTVFRLDCNTFTNISNKKAYCTTLYPTTCHRQGLGWLRGQLSRESSWIKLHKVCHWFS